MKIRRGQIVEVVFDDHADGGNVPLGFVAYGRVMAVTRASITIGSWIYAKHRTKLDINVERRVIVRSAIKSIRVVTEWVVVDGN